MIWIILEWQNSLNFLCIWCLHLTY